MCFSRSIVGYNLPHQQCVWYVLDELPQGPGAEYRIRHQLSNLQMMSISVLLLFGATPNGAQGFSWL